MSYDWTLFFDEFAGDFHPTFQKELSKQLYEKGSLGTGIKHFDKYNFQLIVGMIDLEKKIVEGLVFAKVEFITPTSFTFPVSINWYSDNFENLLEIHQQEISNFNVIFNWADDFPLSLILPHIKPYRIDKKAKTNLMFDIEYYYCLPPDLSIEFYFTRVLEKVEENSIDSFISTFTQDWNQQYKEQEIQFFSKITDIGNSTYQVVIDIGVRNNMDTIKELLSSFSRQFKHLPTIKVSIR